MWSSGGENQNSNNSKTLNISSSSISPSTSSSSSSSSTSPFSSHPNPRPTKTMEEVWKDINLSSLQDQPSSRDDPTNTMTTFSGMIFQDFLARPFDKDPQATTLVPTTRYGSPSPAPAPTHPATMLTLNSGPETFHLFGENNSNPLRESSLLQPPHPVSLSCNGNGKKRFPESENNNNSSSDRRHKRMIKNRESAARSRARKQAYTNELELEVAHLMEENARLKEQQRQVCVAAADHQVPKKHALYRTSTAPF